MSIVSVLIGLVKAQTAWGYASEPWRQRRNRTRRSIDVAGSRAGATTGTAPACWCLGGSPRLWIVTIWVRT